MTRAAVALFLTLTFLPGAVFAAAEGVPVPWPPGPVTFTMPFSQGSETDRVFSLFLAPFATRTGKTLTLTFVPGQAGADAWARMVDDTPNGSVLTAVDVPGIVLRTLQPDSGVAPENMALCHMTAYLPCVLWTSDTSPIASVKALMDEARKKPNTILIAGPGRYSAAQIAARTLDRQAGVRTLYIPYTGSREAAAAVLKGEANAFWTYSMKPSPSGPAQKTSFRALAVAGDSRLPWLPGVPTFRELDLDVAEGIHLGVAVPADTPEDNQASISAFFSGHARTEAFRAKAMEIGFMPLDIPFNALPAFMLKQEEAIRDKIEDYDLQEQ